MLLISDSLIVAISLVFNVFYFLVLVEVKEYESENSICTGLMLNDHSNPSMILVRGRESQHHELVINNRPQKNPAVIVRRHVI